MKLKNAVNKPEPMGEEGSDFHACIYNIIGTNRISADVSAVDMTAKRCRKLSEWLLKAAEWLEAQNNKGE